VVTETEELLDLARFGPGDRSEHFRIGHFAISVLLDSEYILSQSQILYT